MEELGQRRSVAASAEPARTGLNVDTGPCLESLSPAFPLRVQMMTGFKTRHSVSTPLLRQSPIATFGAPLHILETVTLAKPGGVGQALGPGRLACMHGEARAAGPLGVSAGPRELGPPLHRAVAGGRPRPGASACD